MQQAVHFCSLFYSLKYNHALFPAAQPDWRPPAIRPRSSLYRFHFLLWKRLHNYEKLQSTSRLFSSWSLEVYLNSEMANMDKYLFPTLAS